MKINERTILNKGCRICEQEYLSLFPALAVSYYSNRKGLKAELGSERLLEVPLETYILSEKLAIESENADENIEIMKAYMCKQRGTGSTEVIANLFRISQTGRGFCFVEKISLRIYG